MDKREARKSLRTARRKIARGWRKGNMGDTNRFFGRVCLVGGLIYATDDKTDGDAPEISELVRLMGFNTLGEATSWNDSRNREKSEVIDRINDSIKKLKVAG